MSKKYSGVYKTIKKIEIGYNRFLPIGSKVRLYFMSDSDALKVYAYPANQAREKALGKNILHLFEEDFQGEDYDEEALVKKLEMLIKPIKS